MNFKPSKKQLTIIVPVALAVLILSVIGYFVWNNSVKVSESDNTQTVDTGYKVEFNNSFINKISFSYPKTWADAASGYVAKTDKTPAYESHILSSPSKAINVIINVGEDSGVRGNCVVTTMPTPNAKTTLANKYDSSKMSTASYLELIGEENGKIAYTYFGLAPATKAANIKLNGNICDVKADGLIVSLPLKENFESTGFSILSATVNFVSLGAKTDVSKAEYEAALTSDEYKEAKNILMSLTATRP